MAGSITTQRSILVGWLARRADPRLAKVRTATKSQVEHVVQRLVELAERREDRACDEVQCASVAARNALARHLARHCKMRDGGLEEQQRGDGPG